MKVEQLYTGCLSEAAYYIESNGEAVIIDPIRETAPYLALAKKNNTKIKYIFETHFHADFVSGHVDLANKTGATIVYGPNATAGYDLHVASDNEEFKVGDVTIKVLHTPGHTLESSTFLLIDENGKNHAIFSGDTLFLGDVGRPDLAIKSDVTREDLAEMLFDSLRTKIMPLADDVIVYPGHGAGSACGKNMSSETVGLLGEQKATNYALRADMTKEEFVKELLDGILPAPQYFAKNAMMNKNGYVSFDDVLKKGNVALDIQTFEEMANHENTLVLDVRSSQEFTEGHIPDAMFVGVDGSFATWIGALIEDIDQPILLVVPQGREEEVVTRLSRVGYDNALGYLQGGFTAWKNAGKEISVLKSIPADEFAEIHSSEAVNVLDVRKPGEFASEHIEGAIHKPLDYIKDNWAELNANETYYVHCAGGYRSVIEASLLKAKGFNNVINIQGGFDEIKKTNTKVTEFICPSTL
jgi:hydroxyacylglutathione hydrolase